MTKSPPYPTLSQLNTRVRLSEVSSGLGRAATLDDVSDGELDRLARAGVDWLWLLSVWQTGAAGRAVSPGNAEWQREFRQLLPDFRDTDVCGSCFAVHAYTVHAEFGGDAALARLRERIHRRKSLTRRSPSTNSAPSCTAFAPARHQLGDTAELRAEHGVRRTGDLTSLRSVSRGTRRSISYPEGAVHVTE